MKYWHLILALLGAFALGHAIAQEEEMEDEDIDEEEVEEAPSGEPWTPPAWMAKSVQHETLAKSVGEFDVKGEIFMAPGMPPMEMAGTATRTSIMNGFWIQEDFKASFMGQPFEGRMIQGYDNFRKQHVSVWFDNSSPVLSIRTGQDKDGKCVMTGEDPDPHMNKIVGMKSIAEEKNGKMVLTFFRVMDGKEQMHMRLTYTKK